MSLGQRLFAARVELAGVLQDLPETEAYGLSYSSHENARHSGYITIVEAREIMAAIDENEPASRRMMLSFSKPTACKSDGSSEHWPINRPRMNPAAAAWALIHGIEDGWFAYDRAGFLQWTPSGRERFSVGDAATFTTGTGQGAFAF